MYGIFQRRSLVYKISPSTYSTVLGGYTSFSLILQFCGKHFYKNNDQCRQGWHVLNVNCF